MKSKLVLGLSITCGLALTWWLPQIVPEFVIKHSPFQFQRFEALANIRDISRQQWWEAALITGWEQPNSTVIRDLIRAIRFGNVKERQILFYHLAAISSARDSIDITNVSLEFQNDSNEQVRKLARGILEYDNLAIYNDKTDQFGIRK